MSQEIVTSMIDTYSQGIEMLTQQFTQVTRDGVSVESMTGERRGFDQVGAVRMQKRTGRHTDIPTVDTPHRRRWVHPDDYHARDFIDEFDKLQVLNDPTNAYSMAFSAAAARQFNHTVCDALFGPSISGKKGTETVTFPASQEIAAGGTGMTFAKVKQAVRILKENHAIMPGDTLHCFYTAAQEEILIGEIELKSTDFNNRYVLVDGGINQFYRVNFHLVDDEDGSPEGRMLPYSGGERSCSIHCRSAIKVGERKAAYGRIAWLDERETYQVSAGISVGAVRMQETKIVKVLCAE